MELDLSYFLIGIGAGAVALTMVFLWYSHFRVEEGHLAVLVRFGAVVTGVTSDIKGPSQRGLDFLHDKPVKIFEPGAHWKWPWDKVIVFSIMERVIDLSGEKGGKHAMAADGTVLRLDSKIRFFPRVNDHYSYLFELKNPMGHIREMFTCIIRNEIANFGEESLRADEALSSYSVIRQNRKRLDEQVDLICQNQMGGSYGIEFRGVDLIDIVPPQELESALNGVQNAKSGAETLYARAEADARQRLVSAEQGVEIAAIRAKAVGRELEVIAGVIRNLLQAGSLDHYLSHRRSELVGDSKMLFVQRGDLKW